MKTQKKILIIEDEAPLRKALDLKFVEEGYEVLLASDGNTGLKMAQNETPDVILLDIILPKKGGEEILKTLKENSETANIKIIILSNLDSGSFEVEAAKKGAEDYLIKTDWSLENIVDIVNKALNN